MIFRRVAKTNFKNSDEEDSSGGLNIGQLSAPTGGTHVPPLGDLTEFSEVPRRGYTATPPTGTQFGIAPILIPGPIDWKVYERLALFCEPFTDVYEWLGLGGEQGNEQFTDVCERPGRGYNDSQTSASAPGGVT